MSATTKSAAALFAEYRRDHDAALEPCICCLLDSCPEDQRDTLHALFDAWMESADYHRPPYSPVQLRRIEERMRPLFDRVMADPAIIAMEDQREARWRDTPWWRKRWSRARFRVWMWRLRLGNVGRAKPWE